MKVRIANIVMALVLLVGLAAMVASQPDSSQPNYEYLPEMAHSPAYSASVPERSRYISSIDAGSTTGVNRSRTATIFRLSSEHALRDTPTTVASGQRRSARAVGIPERTPNRRQAYDADVTTPRPRGEPKRDQQHAG